VNFLKLLHEEIENIRERTIKELILITLACLTRPRERKWLERVTRASPKSARGSLMKYREKYLPYFGVDIERNPSKGQATSKKPVTWRIDYRKLLNEWIDYCFESDSVLKENFHQKDDTKRDLTRCWKTYTPLLDSWLFDLIENKIPLPIPISNSIQLICLQAKSMPKLLIGLPFYLAQSVAQPKPDGLHDEWRTWQKVANQAKASVDLTRFFLFSFLRQFPISDDLKDTMWQMIKERTEVAFRLIPITEDLVEYTLRTGVPQVKYIHDLESPNGFIAFSVVIPKVYLKKNNPDILSYGRPKLREKDPAFDKRMKVCLSLMAGIGRFFISEDAEKLDLSKPVNFVNTGFNFGVDVSHVD
jgi:hypothetical protein